MTETSFAQTLTRLNARINWERRDRSVGWRVDLAPIAALLQALGDPQTGYRLIHVAGSKGKGSVSSLVTHALHHGGERVGTYGSPHVESITERVRIDGECIAEADLEIAIRSVLGVVEASEAEGGAAGEASWFDIMTAAALVAFRSMGVSYAVLEVGLGGRLDSTNVIAAPEVAVVTTIALEHTEVLGSTLAAIAGEKGGIVKPGSHFVSGCDPSSEAGAVLAKIAKDQGVAGFTVTWSSEHATFEDINVSIAQAVMAALRARGLVDLPVGEAVIAAARLPGRMEYGTVSGVPVVLDGAHVPGSVQMAVDEARRRYPGPFWAVLAVHQEKDAAALAEPILRHAEGLIATTVPGTGVHCTETELVERISEGHIKAVHDPGAALLEAVDACRTLAGGWVFVTGSLYLVGAVRSQMEGE